MRYINENGHASLTESGIKSRTRKAKTIISRLISSPLWSKIPPDAKVLEIGCGSGHLVSAIAKKFEKFEVVSTDIENRMKLELPGNAKFLRVPAGEPLPLFDDAFDLVIMNQVYEHILPVHRDALLGEISRVLKKTGQFWIATPNKFALIEPHYHIPFLSTLPKRMADLLVRFFKLGEEYDCYPPSPKASKSTLEAKFHTVEDETAGTILHLLKLRKFILPSNNVGASVSNISPTLVFSAARPKK